MGKMFAAWRRGLPLPPAYTPTTYQAIHDHIRSKYGHARLHPCASCTRVASQWAYDHTDPAERYELIKGTELVFSLEPERYIPLCRSCHRLFDDIGQPATVCDVFDCVGLVVNYGANLCRRHYDSAWQTRTF